MNDIFKFIYHKYSSDPQRWYPFLSVYYLTYSCYFRCPYCSDGAGKPYYQLSNKTLPAKDVLRVFENIRKQCNSLVITGGEPLNHPEFKTIISQLGQFKFKDSVLTTNGYQLHTHLEAILENISSLVVSLDTLNETKADQYYGIGDGAFKTIRQNIENASLNRGNKMDMVISSVVTPNNIEDLYEVYDFSQNNCFTFAAAPHLEGVKANSLLQNNRDYYNFFDFLVKEKKKKGRKIFGSSLYLEYMRDLKKFDCHPLTILVVSPHGDIFYPCLEMGNLSENILNLDSLHDLLKREKKKSGSLPKCDTRCHSACALSFGLMMKDPFSVPKA